jgi:hypothetical protein
MGAQQSYRAQESLRPTPSISRRGTPLKSSGRPSNARPLRFFGWKEALKQGPEAYRYFSSLARWPKPVERVRPGYLPQAEGSTDSHVRAARAASASSILLPGIGLRPSLPAGLVPTSVVAGDFNGDGKLDWVVANGADNTLCLYLGNGDGTAQPPFILSLTGKSPVAVTAADLNGDGKLDLIVGESDSSTVGILLGNGDGTFGAEVELPAFPVAVLALAVADLNRDGHPDLVVGLAGDFQTPAQGRFATLLNDGTGHFGAPIYAPNVPQFRFPSGQELSVADVNKDGIPDVLVTGNDDNGGSAQIFLGNGDGSFNAGQVIDVSLPQNAVLMDVNGDGCPDAIVADGFSLVVISPGDCKGDFNNTTGAEVYGMGDVAYGLAVVDINGDGHPDLIIGGGPVPGVVSTFAGYSSGDTIGVRLNDGTGHFGPVKVYRGDPGIFSLAVADLARNGHPDVITANQEANTTTVYVNDGSGAFGEPSGGYDGEYEGTVNGFFNPPKSQFFIADINGDGLPDLTLIETPDAMTNLNQITVLLDQGNGQFGPPVRTPALDPSLLVSDFLFADFRHTGKPDFLGAIYDDSGNGTKPPELIYAQNLGNGSFGAPVQIPLTVANSVFAPGALGVGDFNNDGKLDFAVATFSGPASNNCQLTVYLGNGDGTFHQSAQINFGPPQTFSGPDPQAVFVEDANGDGKADIFVWLANNGFSPGPSGTQGKDLFEFLGNGDGTFQTPRKVLQSLDLMTMRDLNHDGRLDVIRIETQGQLGITPAIVSIYLGQPDGTFGAPTTYSPFPGPFDDFFGSGPSSGFNAALAPFIGDFSGNGNIDIAIYQASLNGLPAFAQFLAGNGDGTFTPASNIYSLGIRRSPDLTVANLFGDGHTAFLQTPNYPASYHVLRGIVAPEFQIEMAETPVITGKDAILVSMNVPLASDTTVSLSASDPAVQIPASATIPAGKFVVEVPFSLASSFGAGRWFSITAQGNGTTAVAYDFVAPLGSGAPFSLIVSGGFVPSTFSSPAPGQSSDWGVAVEASRDASSSGFQPSCGGLPAGASCGGFSPPNFPVPIGSVGEATFTVTTDPSIAPGSYPFTVSASDGFVTLNATETLNVGDFTIAMLPASVTAQPGGTATYNLSIGSAFGYMQAVTVTCSNLPAGAICRQQGQTFPVQGTEPFAVDLNGNVPAGTYTFTVTGTSNSLVHSTTAQLQVVTIPGASLSVSQLTFPTILVGATASQTVQLTSSGTAGLSITNIAPSTAAGGSGTFAANSNCGTSLAVQASCTITVTFTAIATGATSGTLTVNDNAPGSPQSIPLSASAADFSLQPANGSSTSATITAGQSAQFTLQIVPNQLQGNVSLACSGAPPAGFCLTSSAMVNISGNSPVTFQVTVGTMKASRTVPLFPRTTPSIFGMLAVVLFLGTVLLASKVAFSRPRCLGLRALAAVAFVTVFLLLANCGGGGGGSGGGGNPGTPPGTYSVTVTASASPGSRTITLNVTVK